MKAPSAFLPAALLLLSASTGCKEYFDLEEACDPKDRFVGSNLDNLDAFESDAFLRLNCHRRLSGVMKASANEQAQDAANAVVSYVSQNPNMSNVFGAKGAVYYLTQEAERPGFTGFSAYDRLQEAGYSFVDLAGTGIWEFIVIDLDIDGSGMPQGGAAIDEFMRTMVFRQVGLQPSWIDGGYAEVDLPPTWWETGGWADFFPEVPLPQGGRAYYMIVLYQAPHFEHVDKPVVYPKQEQIKVPLYSWSINQNVEVNGFPAPTQISYPITFTVGSIDPTKYLASDQNAYGAEVTAASIVDGNGVPLQTEVVHPGDEAYDVWPDGLYLRTTVGLFTDRPLEPSTTYTLYADLTTVDGDFTVDYTFSTAQDDPGLDPAAGLFTPTQDTARRAPPRIGFLHHTAPVDPVAVPTTR